VITFLTRSGELRAAREHSRIALNFPARPAAVFEPPADVKETLGITPRFCARARDYLFVLENEEQIQNLQPDLERLAAWETFGIIVTAPGREVDFVSRFFAPRAGIPEDAVTGSAHCTLVPYWAERLGRKELTARQLSSRGGELVCEALGDRVKIAGEARTYCKGVIELQDAAGSPSAIR
jgi:predicted PhzF superfamily epimerase YddE/YHI9